MGMMKTDKIVFIDQNIHLCSPLVLAVSIILMYIYISRFANLMYGTCLTVFLRNLLICLTK
jgi:hypothetical protein